MKLRDSIEIDDVKINQNGFAVFKDVRIANSNNIQSYYNYDFPELPDELKYKPMIDIFRPANEVEKCVDSFEFLAVTDTHPFSDVDIRNYKDLSVGFSTNTKFEDGYIVASSIVVTDADIIVMLQSKESKELSCGYRAEVVFEAGVTEDGNHYDGYMKNLVGNHVAIVEKGKCGETCRLWE